VIRGFAKPRDLELNHREADLFHRDGLPEDGRPQVGYALEVLEAWAVILGPVTVDNLVCLLEDVH
jgi:hypothetical protein